MSFHLLMLKFFPNYEINMHFTLSITRLCGTIESVHVIMIIHFRWYALFITTSFVVKFRVVF